MLQLRWCKGAATALGQVGLAPAGFCWWGLGAPSCCAQLFCLCFSSWLWSPRLLLVPCSHRGFTWSILCCWSKGLSPLPSSPPPGPGGVGPVPHMGILPLLPSWLCPSIGPLSKRLDGAKLLHHQHQLLPTPGSARVIQLLRLIQLMPVVVHHKEEWNQPPLPLPWLLGERTRWLPPLQGHRNLSVPARTRTAAASDVGLGAK